MTAFDFQPRTRVLFGAGMLSRLGELARALGFRRTLLASDHGLVEAGHVGRAARLLSEAGIAFVPFHDFSVNPDTRAAEAGRALAAAERVDSLIGLGGGSSMDCAKAVNFLLTNGGRMADYRGYGRTRQPLLPMIGIPTTTGTGSEAQSYAVISDAETHEKMACGDPSAAFRVALLDPELCLSQPAAVGAATGYDALSHAVETWVTTRRNPLSLCFAREAWRLLEANYERALAHPMDVQTVGAMLLGAHLAGAAIENSMLGATHACANPLTARYGTIHGVAIALLLNHVVRWNAPAADADYAELLRSSGRTRGDGAATLAERLRQLAAAGQLPARLRDTGVPEQDLPTLAEMAAQQWTGRFNPRPFEAAGALEIYRWAY